MVDIPPEVYKLILWFYTWPAASPLNMAVDPGIRFVRKQIISVLASDTVKPNAAHTTTITPIIFLSYSGDDSDIVSVKHAPKRYRRDWIYGGCSPPTPRSRFLPQMHQSILDVFFCLEIRVGHVYNHREEDVEQEGCEHAPLTKAMFHGERTRAHPVVDPCACSHAMVELKNRRDHLLWNAKTGEYSPQRRVRSTESYALVRSIKHTYNGIRFFRANSCSRRTKNIISVVKRFGRRPLCSSGRISTHSQYSLRR